VKRKIEAARGILLLVGTSFNLVRDAVDSRNVTILPERQFLRSQRTEGLIARQGRGDRRIGSLRAETAGTYETIDYAPNSREASHSELPALAQRQSRGVLPANHS
jgi:hypothetical protein